MKLIDLLVKELPKLGGFPKGANECVQDADGTIKFFDSDWLSFGVKNGWSGYPRGGFYCTKEDKIMGLDLSCDHSSAIITRAQYESALSASEGWIEWGGGECPVDGGDRVDIMLRCGVKDLDGALASRWYWLNKGNESDIIAYRLHKPEINSRAKDDRLEQDLNECIGANEAQAHEWSGIGRPAAGAICQAFIFGEWTDVKIAYVGDEAGWNEALVFDVKSTKPAWADEFRPLRTEAEKAREADIKAMLGVVTNYNKTDVIHAIEQLYDAGYRKEVK